MCRRLGSTVCVGHFPRWSFFKLPSTLTSGSMSHLESACIRLNVRIVCILFPETLGSILFLSETNVNNCISIGICLRRPWNIVGGGAGRSSEVESSLMVRWVVGSIIHGVDPLSYFSFQPVFHDWCINGHGMCYPVC